MAEWIEPVFDRTQADVDYAISQLSQRINTEELKGCFNVSDISRIENNTRYLADELFALYYCQNISTKLPWSMSGLPKQSHVDRIINNIDKLWKAYYIPDGSKDLPPTLLEYEHINTIEKNQQLLKELLDNMKSYFRECGTFECGEE